MLHRISGSLPRPPKRLKPGLGGIILVPLGFLLTSMVTYRSPWPGTELARLWPLFALLALFAGLAPLASHIILRSFHGQTGFGQTGFGLAGSGRVLSAALIGLVAVLASFLPGLHFPAIGLFAFALLLTLCGTVWPCLYAPGGEKPGLREAEPVPVLIYGAGKTGQRIATALRAQHRLQVAGFVDDNPNRCGQRLAGLQIFAPQQIERIAREQRIRRIILALPSAPAERQLRIALEMEALGLEVRPLSPFARSAAGPDSTLNARPCSRKRPGLFLPPDRPEISLPDASAAYRDRIVMVTGAGGSIGAELCRTLMRYSPKCIIMLDISEPALYRINQELQSFARAGETRILPVLGSVTDARSLRHIIGGNGVEVVLHAAAYKHVPLVEANPVSGLVNNVLGTRTLADACAAAGVKRFLLVSSDKAVRPANVMGASKRLAELVVQDLARRHPATQFSIVRFGNVIDSSGSVIPLFREQIARGGPVTLTHEHITRYFMTISEATQLVLMAGAFQNETRPAQAPVFVLDMGDPVRIRDLALHLIEAAGYSLRDRQNPGGDIEIKLIGLRPGEKLHEELLISGDFLRTPHPKILRATEEDTAGIKIPQLLQQIVHLAATGDAAAARDLALTTACGLRPDILPPMAAVRTK